MNQAGARKPTTEADSVELQRLRELTERAGRDPLLTQASTGNTSAKLDGVLWMKASGKWMADATRDDIFVPLVLRDVLECLRQGIDPVERYPRASVETAMHAAMPHRIVLHVHCVNTIAWAVRNNAFTELQPRLKGLPWRWIPYTPSGLPLSREIESALSAFPDTDLFVLGNHGLVIGGETVSKVEDLLTEAVRRLAIAPRQAAPADYSVLAEICNGDSRWFLPNDEELHALGTDAISQAILKRGILHPCQTIFSDLGTAEPLRPIPCPDPGSAWQSQYSNRPILIIEGCGVIVNRSARPAELAMISGLTQVVQRLSEPASIRYLTDGEIAGISGQVTCHYRELANAGQSNAESSSG